MNGTATLSAPERLMQASAMLAMDEVSVAIDGIAVDEMRVVDHDLDAAVRLPAEHPPPDDVRPDEAALERVPDRTFAEGGGS